MRLVVGKNPSRIMCAFMAILRERVLANEVWSGTPAPHPIYI